MCQIKTVEAEVEDLQNQVDTMEAQKHFTANAESDLLTRMRESHAKRVKSIEENNAQIETFVAEFKKTQMVQENP